MILTAKLLQAEVHHDIFEQDDTRLIHCTIKSPLPEFKDWDVRIESVPRGGSSMSIEDEGKSRVRVRDMREAKDILMRRVDAMRPEIIALRKYTPLEVERALANLRTQIVSDFDVTITL